VDLCIAAYLETEKGRYEKPTEMEATKSHYLINVEKKIVSVYAAFAYYAIYIQYASMQASHPDEW